MATSSSLRSSNTKATLAKLALPIKVVKLADLPADNGDKIRYAVAFSMIRRRCQQAGKMHHQSAITYILTVTELIFPGTLDALTEADAANLELITVRVDPVAVEAAFGYTEDGTAKMENPSYNIPALNIAIDQDAWDVQPEILAARWGVEMYPIGKAVSLKNLVGYRINRIDAIKRAYDLVTDVPPVLSTDMLPQYETLKGVEGAFAIYKRVRLQLATIWVDWIIKGADSLEKDAFLVTFRLTDSYGLGAPCLILDTLYDIPALEEFPGLRSVIRSFKEAVQEFMSEPAELRGFVKVRYGSNHRLFAQVTRGALLAVAVAHRRKIDPTVGNFINTEKFADVIAAVDAFLVSRSLPPISPVTQRTVAQTVEEA